ncbi:acetylcholinesterase [Neofusicoccum parvum]|nr:acetylcholinesterase [Neofusicoccum parvum]
MKVGSMHFLEAAASTILVSALAAGQSLPDSLPVVDLGYELYRAADFNSTPPWMGTVSWLTDYLLSGTVPNTTTSASSSSNSSAIVSRSPSQSEDCLFLDVMVPQEIFENAGQGNGAPVLVWIHGGGYAVGSKTGGYDPRNLLQRSQTNSSEGVIFVALNYRLGGLGFLSGPTFQEDGTANVGFYDQRMALQWVQDQIHLFGGDKDRVTVMGESAGAGSIVHQITAYGGHAQAPFQQAIVQSPAWVPYPSPYDQEERFQEFLRFANVGSLAEARNLSTEQVMNANAFQISASPYGSYGWGPTVDGNFVTQDPKLLLNHGQFDSSVNVMVGHNSDEGLLFTPPVTNNSGYLDFVRGNFPSARSSVVDYIANTLYPPVFDGSMGYRDQVGRAALTIGEAGFACNAFAMNRAYNETYSYLFDVFPGLHAQDVSYTFYNADTTWSGLSVLTRWERNQTVAYAMQDYFTSFAAKGVPESRLDGLSAFTMYGNNATLVSLSSRGIFEASDPAANSRCAWWQLALFN